jgi:hypothetical protein
MRRTTALALMLPVATAVFTGVGLGPAAADPSLPEFCSGNGVLQAESLPSVIAIPGCDLTGRVIQDHGIGAVVPAPGKGVFAEGYGE